MYIFIKIIYRGVRENATQVSYPQIIKSSTNIKKILDDWDNHHVCLAQPFNIHCKHQLIHFMNMNVGT